MEKLRKVTGALERAGGLADWSDDESPAALGLRLQDACAAWDMAATDAQALLQGCPGSESASEAATLLQRSGTATPDPEPADTDTLRARLEDIFSRSQRLKILLTRAVAADGPV